MVDLLAEEAQSAHKSFEQSGETVTVSLSRESAKWLLPLLDARAQGNSVIVARQSEEVTPAQAAGLLGVSRPQIRKFMDEGKLRFRLVGSHHRIPIDSIDEFVESQRAQAAKGMKALSDLQNELGLVE